MLIDGVFLVKRIFFSKILQEYQNFKDMDLVRKLFSGRTIYLVIEPSVVLESIHIYVLHRVFSDDSE